MQINVSIILDTRRIKKSTKKYPVKLRVYCGYKTRLYQTVFDLSKEEFENITGKKVRTELKNPRDALKEIEVNATNICKELDPFSSEEFERDFIQASSLFVVKKKPKRIYFSAEENNFPEYEERFSIFKDDHSIPGTISPFYFAYIKELLREDRYSTAISYNNSYQSLKAFRSNIKFTDITIHFLQQFERWLTLRSISRSTVGIYLRSLRTIFNEAIAAGVIKREKHYPFGRRKYLIPAGRNIKKALSPNDVCRIYYYHSITNTEAKQKAKDFWMFSYFANGINMKDIALLKYKNIQEDFIVYIRSKTERSNRADLRPISIFINDDMRRIIDQWGNEDKDPEDYIFPILSHNLSAKEIYETKNKFIYLVNKWMKIISKELGIDKPVTTYVARHTFSTILKRAGAPTAFIQEALGHNDVSTTENYLDSFENEAKKQFAGNLTSFKNLLKQEIKLTVV